MNLKDYFEKSRGVGVLSTADAQGRVDAAIYARPHFLEDGSLVMIMRERLTHKNLQENPHAAYLFIENVPGYQGVRLFLTKIREDQDQELIAHLTRRSLTSEEDLAHGPKYLVYFNVEKILKLIGGEELRSSEGDSE
jgi:hypothetical protein